VPADIEFRAWTVVQFVHFKRKSPSLSNSDLDVVQSDNKFKSNESNEAVKAFI